VIFESVALVGGFLVTSMIGAPLAALLARPQEWMDDGKEAPPNRGGPVFVGGGFEPLDLGPDPMQWPSEIERPSTAAPLPEWPSKSWDDPHFGVHWRRGEVQEVAEARPKQKPTQRKSKTRKRKPRAQRPAPQPVSEESAPEQAFFQQEARQVAAEQVSQAVEQATHAAHEAVSDALGVELPSPAELENMVGTLGLAGTVQEIMSRTDWDFRKAAHYLAKARQRR